MQQGPSTFQHNYIPLHCKVGLQKTVQESMVFSHSDRRRSQHTASEAMCWLNSEDGTFFHGLIHLCKQKQILESRNTSLRAKHPWQQIKTHIWEERHIPESRDTPLKAETHLSEQTHIPESRNIPESRDTSLRADISLRADMSCIPVSRAHPWEQRHDPESRDTSLRAATHLSEQKHIPESRFAAHSSEQRHINDSRGTHPWE